MPSPKHRNLSGQIRRFFAHVITASQLRKEVSRVMRPRLATSRQPRLAQLEMALPRENSDTSVR